MASNYNPLTSDLAGIPLPQLQGWLLEAQTAMHQLSTGSKGESYSYTQGDGAKSVTYTRADINTLRQWIMKLNAQINALSGLPIRRGPMRTLF